MYNWSTDEKSFKNKDKKEIWELEQLINFGLNGRKIDAEKLRLYWNRFIIDPRRRKFLEMLLNVK
ncbi:MAG: hypothetical protein AAB858_01035 [Patescibacteria group bacterium]